MESRASTFPRRNGFALRDDLRDATLQRLLHECLREAENFSGETRLGWSRQWEYPYVLGNLPRNGMGRRILDAGSGYRFFTPMLARRGFAVDACDLDAAIGPQYDEIAARDDLPIEFTRQDLSKLTYPDESFDYICCVSVLEHARDPMQIARECRRCLKTGGSLLLTFDVSVRGDRNIPLERVRPLLELLADQFTPASPFEGTEYLDADVLSRSEAVEPTEWFRRHQPELLPWRFISRAGFANLLRGRFGRPFFDLAVVGLVLTK